MNARDLGEKTAEERQNLAAAKRIELSRLRMKLRLGKVKDVTSVQKQARDLARMLTVLAEKEGRSG
jgi:ribosomal protein L29